MPMPILVRLTPLCAVLSTGIAAQDRPVDFAREVLPILSNKCFVCHGPDSRKKDLVRLDSFEGATRDLGGYRAVDPDAPAKSEILDRIHDAEDPMPPEDSGKRLTAVERDLVTRWVKSGGKYATHWAFVAPRKQPLPDVGVDHPVDAHVLADLRKRKLSFAPEADRATLLRRVALVLTGLPPEPEQLSRFLANRGRDAYEKIVDELLASPRFGEHQARYWLDAVRYGDTHGLHLDNRRGIYPYRDWVVYALNHDLPLDEFITSQLAGDLLPSPTLAQKVATGFVRMNPSTSEGGVIPAEFQAKNSFDRTESFGTVMLGMTMTCARCHTHKYDPISHEEYYRLFAFFNSTTERPLDGNAYTYAPVVAAPADQAGWKAWTAVEAEANRVIAAADHAAVEPALSKRAAATAGFAAKEWRMGKPRKRDQPVKTPLPVVKGLPGRLAKVRLGADRTVRITFQLQTRTDQVLWLILACGSGTTVTVDGASILVAVEMTQDQSRFELPLDLRKGTHDVRLDLVGPRTSTPVEVRIADPWRAFAKNKDWNECRLLDRLRMIADPYGPFPQLRERARATAIRLQAVESTFTTTLVARDLEKRRPTRLLHRGEYNLPTGEALIPEVPAILTPLPKDAPRNRLGLARWLTSRRNPLVARVWINRIWQRTFGYALVRTPEDFGLQGQQPTHPELLDWLAVELQDRGWNLKSMLRLMVTSRVFRQRSAWREGIDDPENRWLARGPGHRLDAEVIRDIALWASGLLDPVMGGEGVKPYQPSGMWAALSHPASNTKRYVQDEGRKLYRRSLYVYWKRTSPHPMMTLFDAPSREASCVRRSRTSTPLQTLGLLNETQRLEMARMLAQRLLKTADDDASRLDFLFKLLACRSPSAGEREACMKLLRTMTLRYANAKKDAMDLLDRPGLARRDGTLDVVDHAAWSQVVITVLASDIALLLY